MIGEESPELNCPYCKSDLTIELADHPYPYKRLIPKYPAPKHFNPNVDFLQLIRKYGCCNCESIFFYSMRVGSDMGLGNHHVYCQVYRQGHYRFREGDSTIVQTSRETLNVTFRYEG